MCINRLLRKVVSVSGVARSLVFGGPSASIARTYGGPGDLAGHALEMLGKEGNALFSYILHHKHDYIEHKIGRMFCSIWIKFLCSLWQVTKKAKEFLCNYKRSSISSTKYEMDRLSSTAK